MRHRWGCTSLAALSFVAALGFLAFFLEVL